MNVGLLQAMLGSAQQLPTINKGGELEASNKLGVSFEELLAGDFLVKSVTEEELPLDVSIGETILALLDATSLEEIAELMKNEGIDLDPTQFMQTELGELLEHIAAIIEKLVNEDAKEDDWLDVKEIFQSSTESELWGLLSFVDENAPRFFAQLTESLEGKGVLPQEDALELLAVLKAASIAASETDLVLKQEQQVFTLDRYLTTISAQLESFSLGNEKQQHTLKFPDVPRSIKIVEAPTMQQGMSESDSKEGTKEEAKSSVHSNVNFQQLAGMRNVQLFTEVEPKAEGRSETLIREMQNILKRSNFGQVGGTNRLLINLNPAHLGQVRVELLHTDGVLTARILASTALGKEMIDSQLNQLRAAFLQQNIQVDRIDVAQTLQDTPRSDKEQQAFQQQSGKGQQKPSDKEQEEQQEEEMTFQEHMIELEV